MKHFWLVVTIILGSTIAFAQTDAELCAAKGGTLSDDDRCLITEEQPSYIIEQEYPLEVTEYPILETAVDNLFAEIEAAFLVAVDELYDDTSPGPFGHYVTPTLYNYYDDILGVQFIISEYTGGANPNAVVRTFAYDLDDAVLLDLGDLFASGNAPLSTLRPLALDLLTTTYGNSVFEDGLAEDEANYDSFALDGSDNTLVFTFDEYQVAPGVAGTPSVRIPLFELNALLSDRILVYRKG